MKKQTKIENLESLITEYRAAITAKEKAFETFDALQKTSDWTSSPARRVIRKQEAEADFLECTDRVKTLARELSHALHEQEVIDGDPDAIACHLPSLAKALATIAEERERLALRERALVTAAQTGVLTLAERRIADGLPSYVSIPDPTSAKQGKYVQLVTEAIKAPTSRAAHPRIQQLRSEATRGRAEIERARVEEEEARKEASERDERSATREAARAREQAKENEAVQADWAAQQAETERLAQADRERNASN